MYAGMNALGSLRIFLAASMLLLLMAGCDTSNLFADFDAPLEKAREEEAKRQAEPKDPNLLRVGVTADYPPLIFRQRGRIVGAEADLAAHLAAAMGVRAQLVSMRWENLIPALLSGRIDIIMSGMTATDARKVRISFSNPYLDTGQFVMMRRGDAGRYPDPASVFAARVTVGVLPGTTGDALVQKRMKNADRWTVASPEDAVFQLKRGTLDLFIYDAPAVMWLVSENEADLAALRQYLRREQLAWGLRRGDTERLQQVNRILAQWRNDGTLKSVLDKWLPIR